MNPDEEQQFEAELRQVRPAQPTAEFMQRLARSPLRDVNDRQMEPRPAARQWWVSVLRWLAPAPAVIMVGAFLLIFNWPRTANEPRAEAGGSMTPLRADDVEVEQELIRSFDALAKLPGGEPVRFRCREWFDQVTVRDTARGLVIEQSGPRIEVVPVRFETY